MQQEDDDDLYYQDIPYLSKQVSSNPNQVTIFQFEDIFKQLEEEIKSIQEMIPFNFDNTLELFIHYNWNKDNIHNKYFSGDQDKIIDKLKASGEFNDHNISILPKQLCIVCLEKGELLKFSCGHSFCRNCLRESVKSRVEEDGYYYARCLQDGCPYRLPYSFIITCTKQYNKVLCKRYIEQSKNLACCTGLDCNRIIKPIDNAQKDIRCECGNVFCFRCKEDLHPPAPCDLVQKWLREIRKDEANVRWIAINTKICPFCKRPVERSEGCNYMMCKPPGGCGKAFCYVCSSPWEPDHKDHFKCMKYKETTKGNDMDIQKEILKRYNFYYERFLNSEASKKKAQERFAKLQTYSQLIYDIYGFTFQDAQFLSEALGELIQSRVVLKWSYCLGYYINSQDKIASQLFDNYQDLFEHSCESLAINLVNLFEEIEIRSLPFNRQQIDNYELKMKFTTMKEGVQGASVKCTQYRRNLELSVYNGDCFI